MDASDKGAPPPHPRASASLPDGMLADALEWCFDRTLRIGAGGLLYAAYVLPTIVVLGVFHPTASLGWRFLCAAALGVFNVAYALGVVWLRDRFAATAPHG